MSPPSPKLLQITLGVCASNTFEPVDPQIFTDIRTLIYEVGENNVLVLTKIIFVSDGGGWETSDNEADNGVLRPRVEYCFRAVGMVREGGNGEWEFLPPIYPLPVSSTPLNSSLK